MNHIRFDWDKEKNSANQKKHGISFEEAQSVFVDENALMIHDPDHSGDEDRFILLGLSSALRLLVVSHTYREGDDIIRLISARKATSLERAQYDRRWRLMRKQYDFSKARRNPYAKRLKKQVTSRRRLTMNWRPAA